jgi:hypothetical protein
MPIIAFFRALLYCFYRFRKVFKLASPPYQTKMPKLFSLGIWFWVGKYQTLISTSTPEGNSSFINASTVLGLDE